METLKDFFQSIFDSYQDRIKSPLIGSFIITFLFYNWRSLAILIYSDWPIHCRIEWIDKRYCNFYNFLLVPLGISLFYVLGLPYINIGFENLLEKYSNYKEEKSRNIRENDLKYRKADAKAIREIADARAGISEINNLNERNQALTLENSNLILQNKDDLNRYNSSIEQFKNREDELKKEINIVKKENNILQNELESNKVKVRFSTLDKYDKTIKDRLIKAYDNLSNEDKVSFFRYFTSSQFKIILSNDIVNKFSRLDLIEMDNNEDNNPRFTTSKLGDFFFRSFNCSRI